MTLLHFSIPKTRKPIGVLFLLSTSVFLILSLSHRLEARVTQAQGNCPTIQNTPKFTIAYGPITLNGQPAPIGTVVETRNPRGDVVGCTSISSAGSYGAMYIYGEDASVTPPLPGMRSGEPVDFYVNGNLAVSSPNLSWSNDRDLHLVTLSTSVYSTGDVNCDGQLSLIDVSFIFDFTGQTRSASNSCPASAQDGTLYGPACDGNGDGQCTLIDASLVFDCTAQINNVLCPASGP